MSPIVKMDHMPNTAEKISFQTAAEIARVENYLNSLRKLQAVLDPKYKKRKYTKRKKALTPNPAQSTEEVRPKGVPIITTPEYMTSTQITGIKNTKKSRSWKMAV